MTPDATTSYSLRATRGDAANVSTLRILAGAAPDISAFAVSDNLIQVGGTVDLTWTVAGALLGLGTSLTFPSRKTSN